MWDIISRQIHQNIVLIIRFYEKTAFKAQEGMGKFKQCDVYDNTNENELKFTFSRWWSARLHYNGGETWAVKEDHVKKLEVAEMRCLRGVTGVTGVTVA